MHTAVPQKEIKSLFICISCSIFIFQHNHFKSQRTLLNESGQGLPIEVGRKPGIWGKTFVFCR